MDYRVLDLGAYTRRETFEYFKSLANPYVGVTVETDVTALLAHTKGAGLPFFLSFLYLAAGAANTVPALRQRIRGDEIVEYDHCGTSHTVLRPDGTFAYCNVPHMTPFPTFLAKAQDAQQRAQESGFFGEGEPGSEDSCFFITTLPWLSYTSLTLPTPTPADSNPRISWGRYHRQGERVQMPVSLLANHALVDGLHMAQFYEALEQALASPDSTLL